MGGAETPTGTPEGLWGAESLPFLGGNVENVSLAVWKTAE